MIRIIDTQRGRQALERLVGRRDRDDRDVLKNVAAIVGDVRRRGDAAVAEYARRFDGLRKPIEVTAREIGDGAARAPREVRRAIRDAARNIRVVAERQRPRSRVVRVAPGVAVELRVVALSSVGCYVPGGRHPLASSLLMTAVPAGVAGVGEIVAVCPRPEPAVLAAAAEAGVTQLFRIGGAHAIAALAYGTRRVPRVEKIVGPGNAWVTAAKHLVSRDCDVDFEAGPTELVIVSAGGRWPRSPAPPEWIAADLIAQAEHDPDARAILITPSRRLADEVARAIAVRLPSVPAARAAIRRNGAILVTPDLSTAIEIAERMAPEHVFCDDDAVARRVRRAGTVFAGRWSAPAAGDYATGSNHVLPTNGAARTRGGLSVSDFVKVMAVQRVTAQGLRGLAAATTALARAEGLEGHALSIEVRQPGGRGRGR
jgi:histidinol dehydrogenase